MFFVESDQFLPTPPAFVAHVGVIPFEFRHDLWHQNTRVMGLTCGVVCVILHLAVLIQYRSVRHTHTDTQTHTHTHTTTAYTALSIAVAR